MSLSLNRFGSVKAYSANSYTKDEDYTSDKPKLSPTLKSLFGLLTHTVIYEALLTFVEVYSIFGLLVSINLVTPDSAVLLFCPAYLLYFINFSHLLLY